MSDLLKDNKELMTEWDYSKNQNIDLNKLVIGSNKKVWWICSKNHSYEQIIHLKTKGYGCPIYFLS